MPLTDITRHRWRTTGSKSQRLAARLDEWAASQAPGTIVPAEDVIMARHPSLTGSNGQNWQTTPEVARRAVRLLADLHVLHRDDSNGHYYVAPPTPAATAR